MKDTDKWQFYDHFWPFLAICMFIFHKTDIQTVISMCLTGLNSDWFKSYDKDELDIQSTFVMTQDANISISDFVQKRSFAFFAFLHFVS